MKRTVLALVLLGLAAGRAGAACDGWTGGNSAWAATFTTLVLIDWRQTREAQAREMDERNWVLGRHPSPGEINRYMAGSIAGVLASACVFPSQWRNIWLAGFALDRLIAVRQNYRVGVRLDF